MYVIDLAGNEYPLQATSTNDGEVNGNQSLSATILSTKANKLFIDDITEMWRVIDHDSVEHKIIYCKKQGEGNDLKVEMKAIPLFFDVLDNDRIYDRYDEHMTAQLAFTRIFEDTSFSFTLNGSFDAVQWEGFGDGETRLETFKRALERYKCEFRIVGNIVYLEHQIGNDTNHQYRHRLNASNIVQEIDANELWTYAKGYGDYGDGEGGEDWQNAKLTREYTSPIASIIGIRHAPPIKNGNITTASQMDAQLKALVDESLKISITADVHDLTRQNYPIAQSQLGDRVFVIDERIGLDEEVRIVNKSITRNWRGDVLDVNLTFGSDGLAKRHQSNLNTALKNVTDWITGRKTIPYSIVDEAIKNATQALKNAQTELKFENGILAIDKQDPNKVVLFNSAGVGISSDGGNTFRTAMTGDGIVADVVYAGTLNADRVTIRGGNATEYTMIEGAEFTSRGKFTRTWMGDSEVHDVSISTLNGRLRFHNHGNDRNLYVSDLGIGTYFGGSNAEDGGYAGSGLIEFFSYRYHPQVRGLTLYSNNGIIALSTDTRNIVLDSGNDIELHGRYVSVVEDYALQANAIRNRSNDTNFYIGVSGSNNGELRVTSKTFWGGSHSSTTYRAIRALGVHGKWFVSPDNFMYLGSDSGVRITSRGVNNNDPIIYRDIQAADFKQRSSRKSKKNIRKCTHSALDIINNTEIVNFDYIEGQENKIGAIAEKTALSTDGEFISIGDVSWNNTKAIQELDDKLSDNTSHLELKLKRIEQKIKELEGA